jgi:hypothetical protein
LTKRFGGVAALMGAGLEVDAGQQRPRVRRASGFYGSDAHVSRDFVCPIEWEPDGEEHFHMRRRCGACGVWRQARVSDAEA